MENQLTIFHRIVYEAVGKYINPTRYCQIIKTESIEKTDTSEEANLLEDQKHISAFDKTHYQKRKSEDKREKKQKQLWTNFETKMNQHLLLI